MSLARRAESTEVGPQAGHHGRIGKNGEERGRTGRRTEVAGFVQIPRAIALDPTIGAIEMRILVAIASYDWGERGNGCTISRATLAAQTGVSLASVHRALKVLITRGLLTKPVYAYAGQQIVGSTLRLTAYARGEAKAPDTQLEAVGGDRQVSLDAVSPSQADTTPVDGLGAEVPCVVGSDAPSSEPRSSQAEMTPSLVATGGGVSLSPRVVSDSDTNETHESKPKKAHQHGVGFTQGFYGDVAREPVDTDADADRLRKLDALGCPESVEWLAVMLGLIARRQRANGLQCDPLRLREFWDAAAVSRRVKVADNPLGELLVGIDRGYLLVARRVTPGVDSTLRSYVERAAGGEAIPMQTVSALGLDQAQFDALVRAQSPARSSGIPAELQPVVARLSAELPVAYRFVLSNLQIDEASDGYRIACVSDVVADLVRRHVLPRWPVDVRPLVRIAVAG